MRHDLLCPWQHRKEVSPGVVVEWFCQCDLIAKARADEREKAAQRIEELGCGEHCGCSITIPNAAAAARGEAS
jgi:hypothetical protein